MNVKISRKARRASNHIALGLFLSVFLIVVSFGMCRAADDQAPARLSVADAVSRALGTHARIKQAEEDHLASLAEVHKASLLTTYGLGARSGMRRTPDDKGTWNRVFGELIYEGLLGTSATLDFTPYGLGAEHSSISLEVRRPLRRGSGVLSSKSHQVLGARADASIRDKQSYLVRQSTVLGVVQTYYQAVLARELVKVQEKAVSLAEEQAQNSVRREKEGLVAGIAVSQSEIQVAQVKDQLNRQQRLAREAMDRLMLAVGSGVGESPDLTDPLPETTAETTAETPALVAAVKTALANRMELGVYDDQLAEQERLLARAKDQLRPSLDVVAGFNSVNLDSGFVSRSFVHAGALAVGLEYRLPIDRRIDMENLGNTERALEVTKRMRTYQMEQIVEQVQNAYRRVESARASLDILTQNRKVAEENLKLNQRMVEEGIGYNRDVLDAQVSLTRTEAGILEATTELYLAGVNLKNAMGEDLAANSY